VSDILKEEWYQHPFEWYESTEDKYVVSLQMSDNKALDILAGLYDIYSAFKRNDNKTAIIDLETLAVLLIAHAMGLGEEAIEELMVAQAQKNMDEFLSEILDEGE
jgi:hypothetical protein